MVLPQKLKLPLCEHPLSRRLLFGTSSAILMLQSLLVHLWGPRTLRFLPTTLMVVHVLTCQREHVVLW
uniref:Uncharacterized protein n=1 Tax=Arundo donax TaxID=35708 RepID=A0A0A9D6Q6_ARUDO